MSSRKAATATKKILYGLLALVLVGGVAYSMSQNKNLMGLFIPGSITPGGLHSSYDSKASDAADSAKTSRDETESYADQSKSYASDAASAYQDEDPTALETAQANASQAEDNAQSAAQAAQSSADEAQGYYESALEAKNTASATVETVSVNVTSSFAAYTAAQEVVAAAETAVSEAETSVQDEKNAIEACSGGDPSYYASCYKLANERLEEAEATLEALEIDLAQAKISLSLREEEYNNYVAAYAVAYTKFQEKKDISDATEIHANTAAGYATEAAAFASATYDYAQVAYSYNFLSCKSLSLSPDSYEMAADDTQASFDLTVKVTGQELLESDIGVGRTSSRGLGDNLLQLSSHWLETFVLADFESTDSSGGSKWLGTLVFETDGTGIFSSTSVETTNESDTTVSFSGGTAGDSISVSAEGEEEYCSESFTITQAENSTTRTTTSTETDIDTDGDGITDSDEEALGTDPEDSDSDDDGLTDYEEVVTHDTDPLDDDTDGDGLIDGKEVETYDTDPNDKDSDDDGLSDGEEVLTYDTDPNDDDSDGDGVDDGDEIDDDTDPNDEDDVSEITVGDETDNPTTTTEEERVLALESSDYSCDDPFTDTRDEWYEEIVCRMYNAEVVEGESKTKFVPGDDVTRAEAIKMIVGLLLEETERDAYGMTSGFSDVSKSDWYYPWLNLAEEADIIRTRDAGATFNPNTPITRGDLALYIARALDLSSYDYEITYDDMTGDEYFAYAIAILSEKTTDVPYDDTDEEVPVLEGYSSGYFKPYIYINRAEALTMIYRGYLAYLAD